MKELLYKRVNWMVVIVSIILFSLFIAVVLPKVSLYTDEVVGGLGSPDTSFYYNGYDLYQFAESYGEDGRHNYVLLRWTFDVVWPLVYLFFLLSLSVQLAKPFKNKWVNKVYWLSILATAFDFFENIVVTIFMIVFPAKLYWLGTIASIGTMFKWILLCLAFAAVTILLVAYIIRLIYLRHN